MANQFRAPLHNPRPKPPNRQPPDVWPNILLTTLAIVAVKPIVPSAHVQDARPAPQRIVRSEPEISPLTLRLPSASAPFFSDEEDERRASSVIRIDDPQGRPLVLYAPPGPRVQGQEENARARPLVWRTDDPVSRPLTLTAPPGPRVATTETEKPARRAWRDIDQAGDPLTLLAPPGPTIFGSELGRPQAPVVGKDDPPTRSLSIYGAAPPAPFLSQDQGEKPRPFIPHVQDLAPDPLSLIAPPGPRIAATETEKPAARSWQKIDPIGEPLTLVAPPGPTVFGQELGRPQPAKVGHDEPIPLPLVQMPVLAGAPPFLPNDLGERPTTVKAGYDEPLPLNLPIYGPAIIPPVVVVGGGGGGGGGGGRDIYRPTRRHDLQIINRAFDKVVAEVMYKDLTTDQLITKVAKEVEQIVKPYRKAAVIDWVALEKDSKRVGKLFALWSAQQQEDEDDDWFMMDT